jgi:hypothetical protein
MIPPIALQQTLAEIQDMTRCTQGDTQPTKYLSQRVERAQRQFADTVTTKTATLIRLVVSSKQCTGAKKDISPIKIFALEYPRKQPNTAGNQASLNTA